MTAVGTIFLVLVGLASTLGVAAIALRYQAAQKDKFRRWAAELKLGFRSGRGDAGGLDDLAAAAAPAAGGGPNAVSSDAASGGPDWKKLAVSLVDAFAPWRVEGAWKDQPVTLYPHTVSHGKSSTTYLVLEMAYARPPAVDFRLAKEGVFDKLGKNLFGMNDIEVGDPAFDETAKLKAADPAAAVRLFGKPELRSACVRLLELPGEVRMDGRGVTWRRVISSVRFEELRDALDLAARASISFTE
jgi:hypothetical protein